LASSNTIDTQIACASYNWIDGNTYTVSNNTATQILTNLAGCDSIVTLNLTINNVGTNRTIPDTINICDGLNIEIEMNASNIQSYQWQLNDGSGFVDLSDSGIYSGSQTMKLEISPLDTNLTDNIYKLVTIDNCLNNLSDETHIKVYESQEEQNPIEDIYACITDSVLVFTNYNGHSFIWDNGTRGQYLIPSETNYYTVNYLENGTNCLMEDEIYIELEDCIDNCIVSLPNAFTPQNSNGVNDNFKIKTTCEDEFSFYEFKIFNRWGEKVFTSTNFKEGWDGTYKNSKAEIGIYVYYLEYVKNGTTTKETINGIVTLIR
jgi:gliding motility-associated-like protein